MTRDETYIKLRCTPQQKRLIAEKAKSAGARSTNTFALTLLLEGNTQEYGSLRRKAEGALTNAELYLQLQQLNQTLRDRPTTDPALLHQAINLVKELGKEVVLKRLEQEVSEVLE